MSKEDKDLLLYFQKAGNLVNDVYQNVTSSMHFESGGLLPEDDEDLLSFLDDDDEEGRGGSGRDRSGRDSDKDRDRIGIGTGTRTRTGTGTGI